MPKPRPRTAARVDAHVFVRRGATTFSRLAPVCTHAMAQPTRSYALSRSLLVSASETPTGMGSQQIHVYTPRPEAMSACEFSDFVPVLASCAGRPCTHPAASWAVLPFSFAPCIFVACPGQRLQQDRRAPPATHVRTRWFESMQVPSSACSRSHRELMRRGQRRAVRVSGRSRPDSCSSKRRRPCTDAPPARWCAHASRRTSVLTWTIATRWL